MSKNLACEVRATRRADRPIAYFKRRRTDKNIVGAANFSGSSSQDHAFMTNETPIYTGNTAPAIPMHTYIPLHNELPTVIQEWPKQLNPADPMLDSTFWTSMMTAPGTSAEMNFGPVPTLLMEDSSHGAQTYQGLDTDPSTQVSSIRSNGSLSGSPTHHGTDFVQHRLSTQGSTPSLSEVQSCAANNDDELFNDAVVEDWSMFKCIPTSYVAINPELGRMYLEGLLHASKASNTSSSQNSPRADILDNAGKLKAVLLDSDTRDKLMGLIQCFLMKGWETHSKGGSRISNTVTLPAVADLHAYFISFLYHYEPFYSIFPLNDYNAAKMIDEKEEGISCLMLLLMVAQGALTAHPVPEARQLSLGITEACRIGMLDLLEKNVSMSIQPDMLRCILVYINLASWSGTRWHMDVRRARVNWSPEIG
jgi:hypothetical protein